ncbi:MULTISPECIES: 2-keto-3-deoxygluconate permease [Pasteurellaceae]
MFKLKRNKEGHIDLGLMDKMMKIPGGLVIIPLLLAVFIKTFFPRLF